MTRIDCPVAAVVLLLAVPTCFAQACGPVQFDTAAGVYRDKLPEFRWQRIEGAASYRVEMVARVPEGPVIERRSLNTELPRTDLPRLDGTRPTKITLTVTPQCGAQPGTAAERMVVVTPSAQCRAVEDLALGDATASPRTLRWRAGAGESFEVRAFEPTTGALTSTQRVIGNAAALPGHATVVTVRRVCSQALGPARYFWLD